MATRQLTASRIVVKVGTSTLVRPDGHVNLQAIDRLAMVLSDLTNRGKEIILVSSGAIGVGMEQRQLTVRPTAIAKQQALAAIGQSALMSLYTQRFSDYGGQIAQLLLTHDVFTFAGSRTHVLATFDQLLADHVIPIVNENDSVAVDELDHRTTFGDNDQLSALVTTLTQADLLIVLSDIDGLYDCNPHVHPEAALISEVHDVSPAIWQGATGAGSRFGTGGMVTKLRAAETVLAAGKQMLLANGQDPHIIFELLAGQPVGTWFRPTTTTKETTSWTKQSI